MATFNFLREERSGAWNTKVFRMSLHSEGKIPPVFKKDMPEVRRQAIKTEEFGDQIGSGTEFEG